MAFQKATPRNDKIVDENPSMTGALTGRNDAIFLKNKYQKELEWTWCAIVNMVHYLESRSTDLKYAYSKIPTLKKNIEAHQKERAELYTNLGNLLTKETNFEEKMWKTTQNGRKVKSITIKQKFKDSDVDEMRYDSMMDFFKQYPEYTSKSSFKKVLEKIDEKQREIRRVTEDYNRAISDYNFKLSPFMKDIKKAEAKFNDYEKIKAEAEQKLSELPYHRSILNKFRSEKSKAEAKLDILHHRIDQFKDTLEIIKGEHSEYQGKKFVEIEH